MVYVEYFKDLLRALPVLLPCAAAIGLVIWRVAGRRPRRSEWALSLYLCALVYALFFAAAGGTGAANLNPFATWIVAFRYGVANGQGMLVQFALNILLYAPAGWLLRWRFHGRERIWLPLAAAFILGAELLQHAIGRVFDIDDVLANGLGVLLGALAVPVPLPRHRRLRRLGGLGALLGAALVCLALFAAEGQKQYGYCEINASSIPDTRTMRLDDAQAEQPGEPMPVYRRAEMDGQARAEWLRQAVGFSAPVVRKGSRYEASQGGGAYLYASDEGRWGVYWRSGDYPDASAGTMTEGQCRALASRWLKKLGLSSAELTDMALVSEGTYAVNYHVSERQGERWLLGDIEIEIDVDGMPRSIQSDAQAFERKADVPILRWEDALQRLAEFPTPEARVENVDGIRAEVAYRLDMSGRYLIPCWDFDGKHGEWGNVICAIAY